MNHQRYISTLQMRLVRLLVYMRAYADVVGFMSDEEARFGYGDCEL